MPKDYAFEGQHEDEEILLVFRRHPVAMRKGLLALLILMLVGFIPSGIWPMKLSYLWFAVAGFGVGLLIMFFYWISWYFSLFIVTEQRFIQIRQKGLFNRSVVDLGLDRIQNVNYQIVGLQETLLGFGTIIIQTYVGDLVIDLVGHPQRYQEKILKIMKDQGITMLNINPPSGEEGMMTNG